MRKTIRFIFFSIGLTLITLTGKSGFCQTTKKGSSEAFASSFPIQSQFLKNGLRVLILENHSSPTFAYYTWYHVGSRNELPGQTGFAHLFEHMMFKQTKNLKPGEFDERLEAAGVEGKNAFTNHDCTVYHQELPRDQLELIVQLESERMANLIMTPESLKTEIEVVHNERRFRNENNPTGFLYQALFSLAFQNHPYRWPVIGYPEDLNASTPEKFSRFYKTFYQPHRATVVLVGDVDFKTAMDLIHRYYGSIPRSSEATEPPSPPQDPWMTSPQKKSLSLATAVDKILMGYRIPAITHPDFPAIQLLEGLLGTGRSSRLYRQLVRSGIAIRAQSGAYETEDPSLFMILADLQKGKILEQAEQKILSLFKELERKPPSQAELQRVKNQLKTTFYQNLESNSDQAHFLGQYATLTGNPVYGIQLHEKMLQLGGKEVQNIVRKYFQPQQRTTLFGTRKSSSKTEKETPFMTVEKDLQSPLVHFALLIPQGSSEDCSASLSSKRRPGLTRFLSEMLLRGTQKKSQQKLAEAFEGMGAKVGIETRLEASLLRATVLKSHLPAFLDLLTEVLTQPGFEAQEIEKLKAETLSKMLENQNQDAFLARERFQELFFQDHPYGCPILGTPQSVSNWNQETLKTRYQTFFQPQSVSLLASGNLKEELLLSWLKNLTEKVALNFEDPGTFQKTSFDGMKAAQSQFGKQRMVLIDKPSRTQTQILIGQAGISPSDSRFYPLMIANHSFGGSSFLSTLMKEIRIKQGWSYGARSGFRFARQPHSWSVSLFPTSQDTPAALEKTWELLHLFRNQGLSQSEFEFAKKSLIQNAGFDYNTPLKRLENTITETILRLPKGWTQALAEKLAPIQREEVNQALKTFLTPEKTLTVIVGTASELRAGLAEKFKRSPQEIEVYPYSESLYGVSPNFDQ